MLSINKRGNIINVKDTLEYRYFWGLYESNAWEEETFNIFDRFTDKTKDYLDIGAWIGPTALYAAHKTKRVFAFEPDPLAYAELVSNISLNKKLASKINLAAKAVAPKSGTRKIAGRHGLGTSETSFLNTNASDDAFIEVQTICLNEFAQGFSDLDICLIKIDIEGFEFELIPTLTHFLHVYEPTLYISLHKNFLAEHIAKEIAAKNTLGAQSIDEQVAFYTLRLIESLQLYKNFYSITGIPVTSTEIVEKHTAFIATNEDW